MPIPYLRVPGGDSLQEGHIEKILEGLGQLALFMVGI